MKAGYRHGDNAPMAVIELVTEAYAPKAKTAKSAQKKAEPKAAPVEETDEAVDGRRKTQVAEGSRRRRGRIGVIEEVRHGFHILRPPEQSEEADGERVGRSGPNRRPAHRGALRRAV
jgi:hypothetical protein